MFKLTEIEQDLFDQVCALIESMNLQAATDGNAIARYVMNLVRYQEACNWCRSNGDSFTVTEVTKDGSSQVRHVKRFPESVIRNELEATLLRLEREFGLTPSARSGLEVSESTKSKGPAAKYLA